MSTKPKPKQRPTAPGTFVGVRMQQDLLTQLDDWRREQKDLPNRSEAVRRILVSVFKGMKR
jgi:metal-responsive CopG/Arc/MetJ family transcriptional regulator